MHSKDVARILSLETGLVSPQFHVKLDSSFKSLKEAENLPPSLWQEKCGFIIPQGSPKSSQDNTDRAIPQAPAQDSEGATAQGNDPLAPAEPPDPDQAQPVDPQLHMELPPLCWSTRPHCPVNRLTYAMACKLAQVSLDAPGELLALQAQYLQEGVNPFALTASADLDSMYYHQAPQEPDWDKFVQGMPEELDAQIDAGNFIICKQSKIPKQATVLPGVWQMKHKQCILTQEVYKWNARLCLDGSHQVFGWDYGKTYAPVADWIII